MATNGAQVIGKVMIDRTIRLAGAPAADPPRPADGHRCPICGALVCEAARQKLFRGMALRCPSCGASSRVG